MKGLLYNKRQLRSDTMEKLKQALLQFKRKTIEYDELINFAPKKETYEQFAPKIIALEKEHILQMIKSRGRNNRKPSLAFRYRINKHRLNEAFYEELRQYRMKLHNSINLDFYFKSSHEKWKKDLPYIEQINHYIKQFGFPSKYVPAPERSYEIVKDEKWIERSGENILHRIKLWNKLKIMPVSDPLMFAINPEKIGKNHHIHLIVENKTTYQALLPIIMQSSFTSLIYGSGSKIEKSIENFHAQLPLDGSHQIYYFGDIDREGVNIWNRLNEKTSILPAIPFYIACLEKESAKGKTTQQKNKDALENFLRHFSKSKAATIKYLLDNDMYYPQEVLKTDELQQIMLTTKWHDEE